MTPERMADVVARWVRFYTRKLPAPIARRRTEEIDADLHDHISHERGGGAPETRIALGIASRMIRGLAADAAWRRTELRRSTRKEVTRMTSVHRSILRVALVTGLILLVPLVANQFSDGEGWSLFDFVLAAVLLSGTGLLLELAASRPGTRVPRVAAVAIGLAAMVLGEADDAPGLVLFGLLLIAGTVALSVRIAQRS